MKGCECDVVKANGTRARVSDVQERVSERPSCTMATCGDWLCISRRNHTSSVECHALADSLGHLDCNPSSENPCKYALEKWRKSADSQ